MVRPDWIHARPVVEGHGAVGAHELAIERVAEAALAGEISVAQRRRRPSAGPRSSSSAARPQPGAQAAPVGQRRARRAVSSRTPSTARPRAAAARARPRRRRRPGPPATRGRPRRPARLATKASGTSGSLAGRSVAGIIMLGLAAICMSLSIRKAPWVTTSSPLEAFAHGHEVSRPRADAHLARLEGRHLACRAPARRRSSVRR